MAERIEIDPGAADELVGQLVHVRGFAAGAVWRLEAVRDGKLHLRTPRTGRPLVLPAGMVLIRAGGPPEPAGEPEPDEPEIPAAVTAEGLRRAEVLLLWFDGACEPLNPGGTATAGWRVAAAEDGPDILRGSALVQDGGPGATNNVAEWAGLELGLRAIDELRYRGPLRVLGDSQLVVRQLLGEYACRAPLLVPRRERCLGLLAEIAGDDGWSAEWIPREQNEQADRLSRLAYRRHTGRPFPARR